MRLKRVALIVIVLALLLGGVMGCKKEQTVTVKRGEIVLCTEGEIISDTTEDVTVPESEVANYSVTTRIETCDVHKKLADLYAQAQAAISKGDLKSAEKLLNELVGLDPTYADAGDQLLQITQGKTPTPGESAQADGNDGGSTPPSGDEETPTGPVMSLAKYVPDTLTGFVAQVLTADAFVLTRDYIPAKEGDIRHLVVVAEQFQDGDAAREAAGSIKFTYSDDSESFKIGNMEAYFGTTHNVAIVTFIDGGIMVAVEGTATSDDGTTIAATLKAVAEEIGK